MLHVKQIEEIIDEGRGDDAHSALDQLLALGPSNTEALKLRATLYGYEGRFVDEARCWEKVAHVDREDADAQAFMLRKHLEDREHFYFTDDIAGGGRRFLAYPRRMVNACAVGLLGCLSFLVVHHLTGKTPPFSEPPLVFVLFGIMVLLPWCGILFHVLTAIKAITVDTKGLVVGSRLKTHTFLWKDIDKVYLASAFAGATSQLSLVVLPKDSTVKAVEIDFHPSSTSVRARTYMVREITRLFQAPEYTNRAAIKLDQRRRAAY